MEYIKRLNSHKNEQQVSSSDRCYVIIHRCVWSNIVINTWYSGKGPETLFSERWLKDEMFSASLTCTVTAVIEPYDALPSEHLTYKENSCWLTAPHVNHLLQPPTCERAVGGAGLKSLLREHPLNLWFMGYYH